MADFCISIGAATPDRQGNLDYPIEIEMANDASGVVTLTAAANTDIDPNPNDNNSAAIKDRQIYVPANGTRTTVIRVGTVKSDTTLRVDGSLQGNACDPATRSFDASSVFGEIVGSATCNCNTEVTLKLTSDKRFRGMVTVASNSALGVVQDANIYVPVGGSATTQIAIGNAVVDSAVTITLKRADGQPAGTDQIINVLKGTASIVFQPTTWHGDHEYWVRIQAADSFEGQVRIVKAQVAANVTFDDAAQDVTVFVAKNGLSRKVRVLIGNVAAQQVLSLRAEFQGAQLALQDKTIEP